MAGNVLENKFPSRIPVVLFIPGHAAKAWAVAKQHHNKFTMSATPRAQRWLREKGKDFTIVDPKNSRSQISPIGPKAGIKPVADTFKDSTVEKASGILGKNIKKEIERINHPI